MIVACVKPTKITNNWYIFFNAVCAETAVEEYVLQRLQIELPGIYSCTYNFIQHIHSPQHKANIHNSDFNRDIIKLTKMFGPAPTKELTVTSTETGSRDDDDSV